MRVQQPLLTKLLLGGCSINKVRSRCHGLFCSLSSSTHRSNSQLPKEMDVYFVKTKEKYNELNEKLMGELASSELAKAAKELSDIGKTVDLIEQRERLLESIAELDAMVLEEQEKYVI